MQTQGSLKNEIPAEQKYIEWNYSRIIVRKRLKQAILSVLIALTVKSNAQNVYSKVYKEDRPAMTFSSVLWQDSLLFLLGSTTDNNPPFTTKIFLGELSLNGDLISYRSIWDGNAKFYGAFFNNLVRTTHNDFVFAGDSYDSLPRTLFGKFKDGLDSVSIIEYQTPFSFAFQGEELIEYDTGLFYLAGVRTDSTYLRSNVMLMKIDSAGNRFWEKYYGLNAIWAESTTSFIKLKNGNLMMGSYRRDFNLTQERSYTWLFEVDTGGTIVRQWTDPNDSTYGAYGLIQTKDGGFVYAAQKKVEQFANSIYSQATVVKMDSSFQKQWTWLDGGATESTGIYDLEELDDGSFIGCGNAPFLQPDSTIISGWVIKLSSSGELLWERGYEGFTTRRADNFLYDIDLLPDGGFIACGEAVGDSGQFGWILRLDSNGCEVENCIIGIDEVQNNEKGEVGVYPNPATTEIVIDYRRTDAPVDLEIFNAVGQKIYSKQWSAFTKTYLLDVSLFTSGWYVVKLSLPGGGFATGKFARQ